MRIDLDRAVRELLAQDIHWDDLRDAVERNRSARLSSSADGPASTVMPPDRSSSGAESPPPQTDATRLSLEPATGPLIEGLPRYVDLGHWLGAGGMGSVRRVRDRQLGRVLAMKVIHSWAAQRPGLLARFLEEAQATAQLQHPGIIPIHDLGQLPDGRLWFTMKEVSGRTLGKVIQQVHDRSTDRWAATKNGWTLRRLITALQRACEAVAHAHERGVLHRDLKPANIMVGDHGEVIVLDWGLAKLTGSEAMIDGATPVETLRSRADAHPTLVGQVSGTPAYMAPEQALGDHAAIGAHSDVYALGATLYQILSGRPPYQGEDSRSVLAQVCSGPPVSLSVASSPVHTAGFGRTLREDIPSGPPLPPALVAACEQAMAREPTDRFESSAALATELEAWLDGSQRTEDGRAVVALAEGKQPEATALRARAETLRTEAAALLKDVEDWQPEDAKLPGWEKEDTAAGLEKQAALLELEEKQLLQASLTHAPELPEAHAALANSYRAEHEAAEASRDDPARAEVLFRQHLAALPHDHPDRPGHLTYLRGDGALSLVTDPPGAEVLLHRYELHHRRLVPRFLRSLGTTPLHEESLPMGSYLCLLRHPDRAEVRYPVFIRRGEHWHGVPPEGGEPHPIPLPRPGELGPDDCYVPAGWFQCGGDPHQERSLSARRIWVDGQVFRRVSTTNRQFIACLDALVVEGRTEEALRYSPRERAATAGEHGALIYGFDGTHFSLRPDADGDVWLPDDPVCMVDWQGAQAFAAWYAARAGLPWRLPGELAWEKAARGVDGRFFPWGDAFDPSWACMRHSHRGPLAPTAVGAFEVDESPYGIRDLAGSMMDWCRDVFRQAGPLAASARHALASLPADSPADLHPDAAQGDVEDAAEKAPSRVSRGGAWSNVASALRSSDRRSITPSRRDSYLGFRLARPYPPDASSGPSGRTSLVAAQFTAEPSSR